MIPFVQGKLFEWIHKSVLPLMNCRCWNWNKSLRGFRCWNWNKSLRGFTFHYGRPDYRHLLESGSIGYSSEKVTVIAALWHSSSYDSLSFFFYSSDGRNLDYEAHSYTLNSVKCLGQLFHSILALFINDSFTSLNIRNIVRSKEDLREDTSATNVFSTLFGP